MPADYNAPPVDPMGRGFVLAYVALIGNDELDVPLAFHMIRTFGYGYGIDETRGHALLREAGDAQAAWYRLSDGIEAVHDYVDEDVAMGFEGLRAVADALADEFSEAVAANVAVLSRRDPAVRVAA